MEILFQDEYLIAVNKPPGMLVHKTNIAADVKSGFAMQTLRDQIGQKVFPLHRIDRPTSGILLFSLSSEIAAQIRIQFDSGIIKKEYLAIVRGHTEKSGVLDYPLIKENGNAQEAKTSFQLIRQFELDIPNERFPQTRYSLVSVFPETGRMHQIRRHFAKKRNYLLGDTKYGDLKSNRNFQTFCAVEGLMLHASKLGFLHPFTDQQIVVTADIPERFQTVLTKANSI